MPSSLPNPDTELFEAVRRGEPDAWERFVTRFERLVYSVPLRMGLSRADAEDVFQNTWVILHGHLAHIRNPASISSWILTTARRETTALRRRKNRARATGGEGGHGEDLDSYPEPLDDTCDPESILERIEQAEIVRAAVDDLDERCRALLSRLYLGESPPSYEDLAKELGMRLGGVGPTRMRCLSKLAESLSGQIRGI